MQVFCITELPQDAQQSHTANPAFTFPHLLSLFTLQPCQCITVGAGWTEHSAACRKEALQKVLNCCDKSVLKWSVNPPFLGCTNILMLICKETELTIGRSSLLMEFILNPVFWTLFNTEGSTFLVSGIYGLFLCQLDVCYSMKLGNCNQW